MSATDPVLVLLAAGASSRLGEPKALVRLREDPPRTPLGLLLGAGACFAPHAPVVVVGAHAAEIEAALPAGCTAIRNARWSAGRTGSVQAAVRARPGLDMCLAPVDVPLVRAPVFRALLTAWRAAQSPAGGWLAPWIPGDDGAPRYGHPLLIGRDLAKELLDLRPDAPLRELRPRAEPLLGVEVGDGGILDDLDTPADLERLRSSSY